MIHRQIDSKTMFSLSLVLVRLCCTTEPDRSDPHTGLSTRVPSFLPSFLSIPFHFLNRRSHTFGLALCRPSACYSLLLSYTACNCPAEACWHSNLLQFSESGISAAFVFFCFISLVHTSSISSLLPLTGPDCTFPFGLQFPFYRCGIVDRTPLPCLIVTPTLTPLLWLRL